MNGEREAIRRCIAACVAARDGRGRWRHANALATHLLACPGTSPAIARTVADAAERVGAQIAASASRGAA